MILVFPVLILAAVFIIERERARGAEGGRGRRWFLAWALAGALMTFSFLAGFSIGLFVLPVAAVALIWVAGRSSRYREATGFVAGIGFVLLLVAYLNHSREGLDAQPWLVSGLLCVLGAVAVYAGFDAVRRSR